MTATILAAAFVQFFTVLCIAGVVVLFSLAGVLWLRERYKRDVAPREPVDWQRNEWIKQMALSAAMKVKQ